MNYLAHYNKLIDRAKNRKTINGEYYERHHIVPKCLGGSNDESNLVYLYPEEHYIAHQLLIKINPGHHGLVIATIFLTSKNNNHCKNNKLYGWLRRNISIAMHNRIVSNETRKKMSDSRKEYFRKNPNAKTPWNKGIKLSTEHKHALSLAKNGVKLSQQHSENISNGLINFNKTNPDFWSGENNPFFGKKHSLETKAKLSKIQSNRSTEWQAKITAAKKGVSLSPEAKQKMKDAKSAQGGMCWVHNNTIETLIGKIYLEKYLTSGWIRGRLNRSNK